MFVCACAYVLTRTRMRVHTVLTDVILAGNLPNIYNMETKAEKTIFWDVAVMRPHQTPRQLAFERCPESFPDGVSGASWFLALILLGMHQEHSLCATELTAIPASRDMATIAGDTQAKARPKTRFPGGKKARKRAAAAAAVREEGQHVAAAKPKKEWVDEALRMLPTPYVHDEYEPEFDGASEGADNVRPYRMQPHTIVHCSLIDFNLAKAKQPHLHVLPQVSFDHALAIRVPHVVTTLERDISQCVCNLHDR